MEIYQSSPVLNFTLPVLGGSGLLERHPGINLNIFSSLGGHPRIVPGCPSTLSCPKIPRTYWDPPGLSLTRSPPCCLEDPKDIPGSSMYVHSPPFCPEDPPSTPTSSPAPSHWLVYILCPQQQLRWLDLLI